jgi:DNA-binding response OmpR family regulator
VVEDYEPLARSMIQGLRESGYAVDRTATGEEALTLAVAGPYDALVLDLMIPGIDGMTVVRRLRQSGSTTPILVVTARDQVPDRIEGLDAGADDYLVKPFAFDELLARLRSVIRRRYQTSANRLLVGDLEIDLAARTARRGGQTIALSAREFALLEYLVLRRGQIVTRAEVWEHVYDFASEPSSNVIDVYVGYLRRKLGRNGAKVPIVTVRSVGYRFDATP